MAWKKLDCKNEWFYWFITAFLNLNILHSKSWNLTILWKKSGKNTLKKIALSFTSPKKRCWCSCKTGIKQCNSQIFISIVNRHKSWEEWTNKKKSLMEKNENRFKSWKTYQNCSLYMFSHVGRNKAFMSLGACENLINSLQKSELFKHFHVLLEKFCFAFSHSSSSVCKLKNTIFNLLTAVPIVFYFQYRGNMVKSIQTVEMQTRNSILLPRNIL